MTLSLAAYSYLDSTEFVTAFCNRCPYVKHNYRAIPDEQRQCPVDFDPGETKCYRHRLYLDVLKCLKDADEIWKGF